MRRLQLAGLKEPERWRAYVAGLSKVIKAKVLSPPAPGNLEEYETQAMNAEQIYRMEQEGHLQTMLAVQKLVNKPSEENHWWPI